MCWGNNSCIWLIIIIVLLFGCGGCGNSCGCGSSCGCGTDSCSNSCSCC